MLRLQAHARGAAIVEMALVVPILITILFFGMFFTELVRAKLKVLEAARFTAWEMTSHVLDDYGSANHAGAFGTARQETLTDARLKYSDLDSISDRASGGFIAGYSGFTASMENQDVTMNGRFSPVLENGVTPAQTRLTGDLAQAYRLFRFDQKGKVQVEVSVRLDNRILPRNFLNDGRGFFSVDQWGGSNLQSVLLRTRFTLIASGWQLPDGTDATMTKEGPQPLAGVHRRSAIHGLWKQVSRMTHLGETLSSPDLVGLAQIDAASFVLPRPYTSTFVVAHNYGLPNPLDRGCDSPEGNVDPSHPEHAGMNNLQQASELDVPYRKCYDTMPFRDTQSYEQSMYIDQYWNRGQYFMGCLNPQADDPAYATGSPNVLTDRNRIRNDCGGT